MLLVQLVDLVVVLTHEQGLQRGQRRVFLRPYVSGEKCAVLDWQIVAVRRLRTSFEQITSDPGTLQALKEAYGGVDNVNLWTGGLSENHLPGAMVGTNVRSQHCYAVREPARRRPAVVSESGF